uniref:hypothetical protein n=1 Tax=Trichocoleus desertorum TaxID=1481672 RepID=UPI0025B369BE|nr:hypothetical protein [Trichocoleus desertorum]
MGRRVININGENYFEGEDDKDGNRVINIDGGTYTEHIQGDVVQGSVINIDGNEVWWEDQPSQQPRQDYSGSDVIDVNATEVDGQQSQPNHTKPWWMD